MQREKEKSEETRIIANLAAEMTKAQGSRVTEDQAEASQNGQDALDKLRVMRRSPTNREIPDPNTSVDNDAF